MLLKNENLKANVQTSEVPGCKLPDSLTKVFAYIGTTIREDQCVEKCLLAILSQTYLLVRRNHEI